MSEFFFSTSEGVTIHAIITFALRPYTHRKKMFSLLKNRKLTLRMIWMKESMKATDPKEAKE